MRRTWIIFVVLFSLLCSCEKGGVLSSDKKVSITFNVDGVTKSSVSESSVNSLDLLVFRTSTGILEEKGRSNGSSITINLPVGIGMTYYAIANAPLGTFDDVTLLSQMSGIRASMDQIGSQSLPMMYKAEKVFTAQSTENISLTRMPCKVTISELKASFNGTALESSTVVLKKIYITNVVGSEPYTGVAEDNGVWHNKMAFSSDESETVKELTGKDYDLNLSTTGTPAEINESFFCYPNPTVDDTTGDVAPAWCPRHSRLVIELTVDGEKNYYAITLPVMEPNSEYKVNEAVLTWYGSESADILTKHEEISFSIDVQQWTRETQSLEFE